jgi:hypothetical protein
VRKEAAEKQTLVTNSNLIIDPNNIVKAGKSIKAVVYMILIMILVTSIGLVIANKATELKSVMNVYIFLGITSIVCNIVILYNLYSAGDNLEKSVKK